MIQAMATALEHAPRDRAARARSVVAPDCLDRNATAVALALFAASLVLTLPLLGKQSIWFDEAVTLSNVQLPYDLGRYLRADATPPLYPLLAHLWVQAFGATLVAVRALSALAGAAAAVALFQLGRRFLDARIGLFAAALLITSPRQIFFAHEARPYAVVLLVAIASFHVLLSLLARPTRRRIVALCLLDAALLYTHYVAAFALLAQALAVLPDVRRRPQTFFSVAAAQLGAVLLVVPLAALVVTTLWPLPMAGWLAPPTLRSIPVELAKLVGSPLLLAFEAALVLAGIACVAAGRRRTRTAIADAAGDDATDRAVAPASPLPRARVVATLAVWAIVPIAAAFAASFVEPVFLSRYVLYTTPAWFLLVGACVAALPVAPRLAALLIAALCLLSLAEGWRAPFRRPEWRAASERARAAVADGALVVVVPAHELLPFTYHFAPDAFHDVHDLAKQAREAGAVGVKRLVDVETLMTSPRDLLIVAAQPAAEGIDGLATALEAAGRGAGEREDLNALVVLRSPAPATAPEAP